MTALTEPRVDPGTDGAAELTSRRSPGAWLAVKLIRGYQHLMSWSPPKCRFAPSCSQYALEAIETHGAISGSWLAVRRISRCHPWNPGGFDPVPGTNTCSHDSGSG
jgi:putative membrane protein insertion efficiency factor